jgi:hypothetical protein
VDVDTFFKLTVVMLFAIAASIQLYQQIREVLFYKKMNWDFDVDNEYSGTTFRTDGPHEDYKESNRHRVLVGRPTTLAIFLGNCFRVNLWVLYFRYRV